MTTRQDYINHLKEARDKLSGKAGDCVPYIKYMVLHRLNEFIDWMHMEGSSSHWDVFMAVYSSATDLIIKAEREIDKWQPNKVQADREDLKRFTNDLNHITPVRGKDIPANKYHLYAMIWKAPSLKYKRNYMVIVN